MNGEHRIEEISKADAVSLGNQSEKCTIAVKTPWAPLLHEIQARLVASIEQLVGHPAGGRLVGELKSLGAKPLHTDNRNEAVWEEASYRCIGLKVFESNHGRP
jgi:hypothetical protein